MRMLKIAAYVVGGVIALLAIALVAVVVFVDPNDFRDDIARLVEEKTGRKLTLQGELDLSVFPWLALKTGAASLGEAPGFGTEPFVAIEQARVGVRLLPLLRGKIEVGDVGLDGARIRLITDEQGRNNWEDLGAQGAENEPTASKEGTPTELPTVAGLTIRNASVAIENRKEGSRQVVHDFNLETGRVASGKPFDVSTDFVLDQQAKGTAQPTSVKVNMTGTVTADLERNAHLLEQPRIELTLTGPGQGASGSTAKIQAATLRADLGERAYGLDDLTLEARWNGEGVPQAGIPVALKAKQLAVNLARQTLDLNGLEADVAGGKLAGSLKGEEILDAPRIGGPLKLEPVSLREWLPKLGVALPATRDPDVLKRTSFSANVKVTKNSAELGDVVLTLDDTTAKGMLAIADFTAKALRFDLNIDRINADRYLPPPSEAAPKETKGEEPPADLPVDALRNLNARGQLQVGEVIFSDMKFTKLRLGVNAKDGKVRLNPSEASMYGGQYKGDIGIDATGKVARVSLDEHLSGIDFAPLFKDLFKTNRVSGKGAANIKLTGSGRNTDDIVKTFDGTVDFKVSDGALEGTDLWWEIRRARALFKQQPEPAREVPPRTPFSALEGTGVMKSGVLSNNDLNVAMQYLRVTGQGTVDLPKDSLDYRLMAAILKIPKEGADATQMQDMVDAEIPVRITGPLTDPKVRPDLEGYAKAQIKQRVDEERGKLEEKVKEKIGDKLKDLFNRR